jgi:hypothetical protein
MGPAGPAGPPGPQGPQGYAGKDNVILNTGTPRLMTPNGSISFPEGTYVVGTDRIGQIVFPKGTKRSTFSGAIIFAKAFAKVPVCVATADFKFDDMATVVPAVSVHALTDMMYYTFPPIDDTSSPMTINYMCFEIPEREARELQYYEEKPSTDFVQPSTPSPAVEQPYLQTIPKDRSIFLR